MTAEYRQRADLLGTQVITRSNGRRLGVVSQLWVDVDSQEIVAMSLRPSLFYGSTQEMLLTSVRQIGDVILVENEDVIEEVDTERYNSLINCEVITETGEALGKVRGFKFDVDNGKLASLTIATFGYPLIPDRVLSTYELPIEEIVSSGPDRLIVYEGAEERLSQLSVGLLEQVGIGSAPWEKDNAFQPPPIVRPENQLPSATRVPMQPPAQRTPEPDDIEETWDEDNWEREPERVELRPPEQRARQQMRQEPENWSEDYREDDNRYPEPFEQTPPQSDFQDVEYAEVIESAPAPTSAPAPSVAEPPAEVDVEASVAAAESDESTGSDADPWAPETSDPPSDYKPQAFTIPETVKQPEPEFEE
ncbi:PRC-barrel domain-containing protein [filamentous cyanobacterium LEGE 11480]|uniref:PRC-barrel domain-containing protein n=1 Tax=Romeriopsis navalis LEGE 11480 TaxID=2777977 RepID=A0A928Z2G6_9CYAN|nr:PRC-barrel domain-containing protein [Romeriopsis navalis]MBE9028370.1 PRC-barrel domain-containing protein [Romeriopsis navalis LEGE 11480]